MQASLRTNQLTTPAFDWFRTYLDAVEMCDVDQYQPFITEDSTFQWNNDMPVYGQRAVSASYRRYLRGFASVKHDLLNIYGADENFMAEMLWHYTRHDGSRFTTSAAAFIDRNRQGLITSIRIFVQADDAFGRYPGAND